MTTTTLHTEKCGFCTQTFVGTKRSAYLALGNHVLRYHSNALVAAGVLRK